MFQKCYSLSYLLMTYLTGKNPAGCENNLLQFTQNVCYQVSQMSSLFFHIFTILSILEYINTTQLKISGYYIEKNK